MCVSSVFFTPARPCLLHIKRSKVFCKHGTAEGIYVIFVLLELCQFEFLFITEENIAGNTAIKIGTDMQNRNEVFVNGFCVCIGEDAKVDSEIV